METIQDNKVRYDNTDFVTTLMNQQARTVVLEMEGIKYDHSISNELQEVFKAQKVSNDLTPWYACHAESEITAGEGCDLPH